MDTKYRKVDGRRFIKLDETFKTKADAVKKAKKMRKDGSYARVYKEDGRWTIWGNYKGRY